MCDARKIHRKNYGNAGDALAARLAAIQRRCPAAAVLLTEAARPPWHIFNPTFSSFTCSVLVLT